MKWEVMKYCNSFVRGKVRKYVKYQAWKILFGLKKKKIPKCKDQQRQTFDQILVSPHMTTHDTLVQTSHDYTGILWTMHYDIREKSLL